MARKTPLSQLLQLYRAEIRASGNPAHSAGVREAQVLLLQRVQEYLWDSFDWAFLRVERFDELQAGQRYYDPPADLLIDRVEEVHVRYGTEWMQLCYGISEPHYALYDSYTDQRGWPVERWELYEDEQIELWPIPSSNSSRYDDSSSDDIEGRIRYTGIRSLNPLVADDDTADLDDRLIVLYAAAEQLAADGAADAQAKAQAAKKRFEHITGNMSKIKRFSLFGVSGRSSPRRRRPPIPTVHYRET